MVALIADRDERTGNAYWHELQYPDGRGGEVPPLLVLCVQVACECGWRSPRIRAPRGVVWSPWNVTIASPLQEEQMRELWRSHLANSSELAIVPIWEKRIRVELGDWPDTKEGKKRAKQEAISWTVKLREKGLSAAPRRGRGGRRGPDEMETVADYVERWLSDRERRGLASVATDRGHLKLHVFPVIGPRPIRDVTRDELRGVVEKLDRTIESGSFTWKTAQRCWGLVTNLFADACDSKTASLRVRPDNPARGVRGPDRGGSKSKQWLFPVEMARMLACEDVPVRWRRLYALAAYLYVRPGELAGLEWSAVNLEQGYVHVHQALDMRTGKVKPTKTKVTRRVPIPLALRPLFAALRDESGARGRVIQNVHPNKEAEHGFPPLEDLAETLREHIGRAGVTCADLYDDTETTKRLTFYDLRATGITWEAIAGTDPLKIMQRAGHLSFTTTQIYIRQTETIGVDAGKPFSALPASLLGSAAARDDGGTEPGASSTNSAAHSESSSESTGGAQAAAEGIGHESTGDLATFWPARRTIAHLAGRFGAIRNRRRSRIEHKSSRIVKMNRRSNPLGDAANSQFFSC